MWPRAVLDGRAARTGEGPVARQRGRLDRNGVAARRRSAAVLRRSHEPWRARRCFDGDAPVPCLGPFHGNVVGHDPRDGATTAAPRDRTPVAHKPSSAAPCDASPGSFADTSDIWLLAGVVLAMLCGWVSVSSERIVAAIALVALWHCSPARQRCLNACHRVPTLRVFGTAAQWDSLRYGVSTGWYCAGTCGLAMLLVLLAKDYHLIGMALVAVVATVERHLPARRPGWRLPIVRGRSPEWPSMPVAIRSAGIGWR